MSINQLLSGFAFWDEVLNDADSDFFTDSVHMVKCGYC